MLWVFCCLQTYLCAMPIQSFTFNPLSENTYIVWDENTRNAALIDAGMYNREECNTVKDFLTQNQLTLTHLLGTHAHIDHIFGNWYVKQEFPEVPYYLHQDDVKMIQRSDAMAAVWNLDYTPSHLPDQFVQHGDSIIVGTLKLDVRFVPGHSPGHVIYIQEDENFAVVGDCVFQGSIGRTDLPGGNHDLLLEKIRSEIFTLPSDMQLFCGHGPSTQVQKEINTNPFFN
jgi:glyoxylase-like metal-dependent hydrolase (beta-lactamase superfamily II)